MTARPAERQMTVRLCILAIVAAGEAEAEPERNELVERKFLAPRALPATAAIAGDADVTPAGERIEVEPARDTPTGSAFLFTAEAADAAVGTTKCPGAGFFSFSFFSKNTNADPQEICYPATQQKIPGSPLQTGGRGPLVPTIQMRYVGKTKKIEIPGGAGWSLVPDPVVDGKGVLEYYVLPERDCFGDKPGLLFRYEGKCCSVAQAAKDPRKLPVPDGYGTITYRSGEQITSFAGNCAAAVPTGDSSPENGGTPLPVAVSSQSTTAREADERSPTITYSAVVPDGEAATDRKGCTRLTKYEGPVKFDSALWRPVPDPQAWAGLEKELKLHTPKPRVSGKTTGGEDIRIVATDDEKAVKSNFEGLKVDKSTGVPRTKYPTDQEKKNEKEWLPWMKNRMGMSSSLSCLTDSPSPSPVMADKKSKNKRKQATWLPSAREMGEAAFEVANDPNVDPAMLVEGVQGLGQLAWGAGNLAWGAGQLAFGWMDGL